MADKYQTQCPHCGVKFQINSQQLALANGNVRCGSCLQVFQASNNLVPLADGSAPAGVGSARPATAAPSARPSVDAATRAPAARPAAPAARPPSPPARPQAPPPPPASLDDTDDDLADMILKELEAPPPAARPAARPVAPPPPAKPAARAPAPPAAPASDLDIGDDDLADMILRELDENPAPAPVPVPPAASRPAAAPSAPRQAPAAEPQWAPPGNRYGIEDNKTRVSLGDGQDNQLIDDGPDDRMDSQRAPNRVVTSDDSDVFGASASTLLDKIDEPVDESWAKELLGEKVEDEKDALVRKFTEIKADSMALATTGVQQKSALQERLARLESGDAGIDDDMLPLSRNGSSAAAEEDELDFLSDGRLTMQDVEIPGVGEHTEFDTVGMAHQVEWGREIFWGALCAVFSLVLLGQYLVFNFDDLSRDESWRGIYEVACGATGCELPEESDVTRIQGANLVVRSHPAVAGALVVDAIVYNRAPFAQPYPDLELSFSDSSGNLLAGRIFTPKEYLRGELAGSESMPPDTPVHLSLELVDPGEGAVNYELRFLPPAASS